MLLDPTVWRGLTLHDYGSWAHQIWHILALRATRRFAVSTNVWVLAFLILILLEDKLVYTMIFFCPDDLLGRTT